MQNHEVTGDLLAKTPDKEDFEVLQESGQQEEVLINFQ